MKISLSEEYFCAKMFSCIDNDAIHICIFICKNIKSDLVFIYSQMRIVFMAGLQDERVVGDDDEG